MSVLLLTGIGANIALADMDEIKAEENSKTDINIIAGYRGVSEDNNPSRALEYDSLKSSPLFNVDLATDQGSYFLNFNFDYLNENDYSGELNLNSKGLAQVNLRSERFFHSLDHIPYDNGYTGGEPTTAVPDPPLVRVPTGRPAEGSRPDGEFTNSLGNDVERTFYTDQNPSDDYGLRLDTNEFKVRVKHPTYPAHLNLAYWRYEKKGDKQLRFVGENCATACHMQSKTRKVDRVTEEFKAEVDAHVGIVDLGLETLFRTFHDRESIPRDNFGSHSRGRDISGNPLQHSEDPDSQITELTLKANTAPSGGLVGSASFTIGKRENESDLTSISPVKAETDYYKTAADATYTPSENWTFNLRYRLLDLDSDNTDQFSAGSYGNTNNNPLEVRDPVDITRSWYQAIVNYRPSRHLTLKGELRREDIDRSNTGHGGEHESIDQNNPNDPIQINPRWELPDEETITLAKLGFSARLLEKSALKFSGWVSIQHSDDPAYGSSFEDSQQLFLSGSYNPSPFWGFLANARFLKQENDSQELYDYEFKRDKDQQNINLGTYVTPRNGLSFDLNYGYFHTEIDQGILVGTGEYFVPRFPFFRPVNYAIADDSGDYEQTINTLTLGMTWQILEALSCRLEGHYSESEASFSPDFNVEGPYPYNIYGQTDLYYGTQTSSDLKEISELDIQQIGLRGRINWKIDEDWSCSMETTYDDYDDKNSNYYDGSVQTAMVSFSRSW